MTSPEQVPFLIIGGGIGGMTAALSIARAGMPVHVIEKAVDFGEIGAGIQLAPNALRVLDGLDLFEAVEDVSVKPEHLFLMHTESGECLTTLDFGFGFRERYGYPYVVLHRGDLLDILLDACRDHRLVTLESDKEMVEIVDGENYVHVECRDGSIFHCKAVVGADGLWSQTRSRISSDEPLCHGYVAYRGAVLTDEVSLSESDDEYIWIGPGKHFVQYPIRAGELYNQVAVFASRRFRPEIADTSEWGTPEELDESFSGSCERVASALKVIERDRRWPMYDREPIDSWTRGRVTLLGDAAHPMLQYLAQGACQAIEDASCMAGMMAHYGDDIERAFQEYQSIRIPRTTRVQEVARWWGRLWHDDGDMVPGLRDRIFASRADDDYRDLDWLYH